MIKQEVTSIFSEPIFSSIQDSISVWKAQTDTGYACHLFVIEIQEILSLNDIWSAVSARIATAFQSKLKTEIEMYNIYLLFLCRDRINNEVKYKIEQDKYCCRKLVIDSLGTTDFSDERIQTLISEKIFLLPTLPSSISEIDTNDNSSVADILAKREPEIFKILTGYQSSNKKFDPYYVAYKTASKL